MGTQQLTRGGRRDSPLRNAMEGHPQRGHPVPGRHRHPPCLSLPPGPRPVPGRRRFRPPLPPAHAELRPPHLVPFGLAACLPHPSQEFHEPPCPPPVSPRRGSPSDEKHARSKKLTEVPRLRCCHAATARCPVLYVPGQCLEVRHGHVARGIRVEVILGRLADGHRLWRQQGGGGVGGSWRWLCAM